MPSTASSSSRLRFFVDVITDGSEYTGSGTTFVTIRRASIYSRSQYEVPSTSTSTSTSSEEMEVDDLPILARYAFQFSESTSRCCADQKQKLSPIKALFVSSLHPSCIAGIPSLLYSHRTTGSPSLHVCGPVGIGDLMDHISEIVLGKHSHSNHPRIVSCDCPSSSNRNGNNINTSWWNVYEDDYVLIHARSFVPTMNKEKEEESEESASSCSSSVSTSASSDLSDSENKEDKTDDDDDDEQGNDSNTDGSSSKDTPKTQPLKLPTLTASMQITTNLLNQMEEQIMYVVTFKMNHPSNSSIAILPVGAPLHPLPEKILHPSLPVGQKPLALVLYMPVTIPWKTSQHENSFEHGIIPNKPNTIPKSAAKLSKDHWFVMMNDSLKDIERNSNDSLKKEEIKLNEGGILIKARKWAQLFHTMIPCAFPLSHHHSITRNKSQTDAQSLQNNYLKTISAGQSLSLFYRIKSTKNTTETQTQSFQNMQPTLLTQTISKSSSSSNSALRVENNYKSILQNPILLNQLSKVKNLYEFAHLNRANIPISLQEKGMLSNELNNPKETTHLFDKNEIDLDDISVEENDTENNMTLNQIKTEGNEEAIHDDNEIDLDDISVEEDNTENNTPSHETKKGEHEKAIHDDNEIDLDDLSSKEDDVNHDLCPLDTNRTEQKVEINASNGKITTKSGKFSEPKQLRKILSPVPHLLVLGTGCASPSALRGSSGYALFLPTKNTTQTDYENEKHHPSTNKIENKGVTHILAAIIDCGEGYLTALSRHFPLSSSPVDNLSRKLRDIRLIWISHAHFDHYGGLPTLLRAIYDANIQQNSHCDCHCNAKINSSDQRCTCHLPPVVIAPPKVLRYLDSILQLRNGVRKQQSSTRVDSRKRKHPTNSVPYERGEELRNRMFFGITNGEFETSPFAQHIRDMIYDFRVPFYVSRNDNTDVPTCVNEQSRKEDSCSSDQTYFYRPFVFLRNVSVDHCPYAYALIIGINHFSNPNFTSANERNQQKVSQSQPFYFCYSGDTRPSPQLVKACNNINIGRYNKPKISLLLHESTFDDDTKGRMEALKKRHTTVEEALMIANEISADACILTHFSQRYPNGVIVDSLGLQSQSKDVHHREVIGRNCRYICSAVDGFLFPLSQHSFEALPILNECLTKLFENSQEGE